MLYEDASLSGTSVFGLAIPVTGGYWSYGLMPHNLSSIAEHSVALANDPFRALLVKLEFHYSPYDIIGSAGFSNPDGESGVRTFQGVKPSSDTKIGRLHKLKTISDVLRFLQGPTSPNETARKENSVGHINMIGSVVSHAHPPLDDHYSSPWRFFYTAVIEDLGTPSKPYYAARHGTASQYSSFGDVDQVAFHGLTDLRSRISEGEFSAVGVNPPFQYNYKVDNLSWNVSDDTVSRVFYTVENTAYGNPGDGITDFLWYKRVGIVVDFDWSEASQPETLDVPFHLYYHLGVNLSLGFVLLEHYTRSVGEIPVVYTNNVSLMSPLSAFDHVNSVELTPWFVTEDYNSKLPDLLGYDVTSRQWYDSNSHSFVSFARVCTDLSSDMIPAACLAQGDALDTGFSTLSFNMLEFFVELRDLARPLEFAQQLNRLLTKSRNNGDMIFNVLKSLADWKLLYSFGYAPTERGAREIASKIEGFARRWEILTGWQTFYGVYEYEPTTDEFPFIGSTLFPCKLIGRSKLRLRVPPDSLLPALLHLDQLGSLPTLSRVWDTLPFSFILDWFFNISGKLEVVDLTAKLAMLEVAYVVNSISMIAPFSDSDQDDYGFYSVAPSPVQRPAGYKYFARYVLPSQQVFTPTRFGFLAGHGVPDYWLAGSLVFRLST